MEPFYVIAEYEVIIRFKIKGSFPGVMLLILCSFTG